MSLVRTVVLGVALVLAATAGADDKPGKLDPAKLVGEYKATAGMKAGEKAPEDSLKGKYSIAKDKITIDGGNTGMKFVFGYKVKADADPAEIDLEILEPEGFKGAKAKGIISLDGKTVKLCYHPMDGDRPKKFESTKENGCYLFTLEKTGDK